MSEEIINNLFFVFRWIYRTDVDSNLKSVKLEVKAISTIKAGEEDVYIERKIEIPILRSMKREEVVKLLNEAINKLGFEVMGETRNIMNKLKAVEERLNEIKGKDKNYVFIIEKEEV